ncbi:MAG: YjfB family protein [Acetatifactor sp.]|nr:YjfB family protein [Acetatifactor sp.]
MDIAGVSSALSNVSLQSKVSVAVLDKAMETNKSLGEGIVEMIDSAAMERSVNPHIGSNLDMWV